MIDQTKSVKSSVNEQISELYSGSIVVSKINEENLGNGQPDGWNKWTPSIDPNNDKIVEKQAKL